MTNLLSTWRRGRLLVGLCCAALVPLCAACDLFGCDEEEEDYVLDAAEMEDSQLKTVGARHVPLAERRAIAELRRATVRYHRIEVARKAGYDLLPDLDHCFSNPPIGAMGFHYIDARALDLALDPTRPEAMVYAPGRNGRLHLAAVEFIVPAAAWDAANTGAPEVLGHKLHLNAALGVYVLHAWIWKHNPAGMFEDWNPLVTCP